MGGAIHDYRRAQLGVGPRSELVAQVIKGGSQEGLVDHGLEVAQDVPVRRRNDCVEALRDDVRVEKAVEDLHAPLVAKVAPVVGSISPAPPSLMGTTKIWVMAVRTTVFGVSTLFCSKRSFLHSVARRRFSMVCTLDKHCSQRRKSRLVRESPTRGSSPLPSSS